MFWKEIHALFHFWWLSGYSNPSALCGQTWSLDKPPLKTMWIFMRTPHPFYFKNIGIFFNFWIQSLHKIDSSIQMFVLDLLIPICLVFKVWLKKKFPCVCRYYVNSFSFCEKSLKAVKSRHSELSKMVRQAHVVQKIPPGSMIEQKNVFCKNTIFVKKIFAQKSSLAFASIL